MTQALDITPAKLFAKQTLKFHDIPANHYDKTVKEVLKEIPAADLLRIWRDMQIIREFETSLDSIKKEGTYQGIEYNHKGPAHLSIGQEASAVGEAYHLDL